MNFLDIQLYDRFDLWIISWSLYEFKLEILKFIFGSMAYFIYVLVKFIPEC